MLLVQNILGFVYLGISNPTPVSNTLFVRLGSIGEFTKSTKHGTGTKAAPEISKISTKSYPKRLKFDEPVEMNGLSGFAKIVRQFSNFLLSFQEKPQFDLSWGIIRVEKMIRKRKGLKVVQLGQWRIVGVFDGQRSSTARNVGPGSTYVSQFYGSLEVPETFNNLYDFDRTYHEVQSRPLLFPHQIQLGEGGSSASVRGIGGVSSGIGCAAGFIRLLGYRHKRKQYCPGPYSFGPTKQSIPTWKVPLGFSGGLILMGYEDGTPEDSHNGYQILPRVQSPKHDSKLYIDFGPIRAGRCYSV
jgi:hypothetical protein